MQNHRFHSPAPRRTNIFRLRPLGVQPPVGRWAFTAHGDALLPGVSVRSNDVLCVSAGPDAGALQVLEPQTPGHPMLGHRYRGELRTLPANLPCSDSLWSPVGSVTAIWRRGLSSLGRPSSPAAPSAASPRRAVCVRVPQAALALVRAERPELMSTQLQAAPQPGGTVLVFPGSATDAAPVAQATARQLQELADSVALALGPGAQIQSVSASDVCVTAWRSLDLSAASRMARSLVRKLRLTLSVAVADSPEAALQHALSLGGDQLLYALPPQPGASPVQAPVAQAVRPVAASRPSLVPRRPPVWVGAPAAPQRPVPMPSAVEGTAQLGLFDRAEAA